MRSASELETWLTERDGLAHSSAARAAGFSPYAMRAAVSAGIVERVRRSWLVTASCDERRRRAAALGGRVTCLSAASMLGLWTPDHDELHVVVPSTAARTDAAGVRLHWGAGVRPVPRGATVDPVLNVLAHVARCAPMKDAAAVWESALRKKLVSAQVLARVAWRGSVAGYLALHAGELSDSGLETRFVLLMRSLGVDVVQQPVIDGRRVDALIGRRLVVELDGFAHHRAAERRRDLASDARLALRGYTVLRFDYQQVFFEPAFVLDTVATAVAQGLHR